MKKLNFFLALVLLLASFPLSAQEITVKGVVTDEADGVGIPYATVQVKGTLTGVNTDQDGNYSITLKSANEAVLTISCVGYATKDVEVNGKSNLNVALSVDNQLDETIVVAYGTATKHNFTGSAAMVKSDEIEKQVATNVTSALAGTTSGVQVLSSNGDPTSNAPTIRIRGIGSMSASSAPLVILDGAPYDGSISSINPSDVESMSVLKDAAASAIYGHRGANGVIIITTKKGKVGDAQVKLDMKFGSNSRLVPQYDVISDPAQYYETHFKLLYNSYLYSGNYTASQAYTTACKNIFDRNNGGLGYQVYTYPKGQELIGTDFKLNPNATLGYTDGTYYYTPDNWYNSTYHNSFRQEYNVSVSGASDRFNYFASAGFLDDGGIVNNSDYKRFTARVNAEYQAKKWLKFITNLNYTYSESEKPYYSSSYGSSGNLFYITNTIGPIYPLYVRNADGTIAEEGGRIQYDANQTGQQRPSLTGNAVRDNEYDSIKYRKDVINGKVGIDITPIKGLSLKANVSFFSDNERGNELYTKFGSGSGNDGVAYVEQSRTFSINQQYLAQYNLNEGKNHFEILAGYEQMNRTMQSLYGQNDHLYNVYVGELSNACGTSNKIAKSYTYNYMTEGFLVRAQYDWAEKYFVEASYRRDASSRFAKGHNWGNFWSASAGWVLTNEDFLKNVEYVNFLKLKASYGSQGNDNLGSSAYYYYAYADQYTASYNEETGEYALSMVYKGNENLTWEKINSFNVGFDFEFLNGYLNGSIEYFNRRTNDLLYLKSVPLSAGNPTGYYPTNVGSIRNQGFDLDLNGKIISNKKIQWKWNANFSHYTNKILSLDPDVAENGIKNSSTIYTVGGSLYNAYLYKYAGVNQENGKAQYYYEAEVKDADGNVVLGEDGKAVTETKITENFGEATRYDCGSVLPKLVGGFGMSFNGYGIDFSIQCGYQVGGKYYDGSYQAMMLTQNEAGSNYHKDLLKAWTPENTNTDVPRLDGDYSVGQSAVDRFQISSDYISLNNITLGYTFPRKWTEKAKIAGLRIYFAGENLALGTARKGIDPRFSYGTGSFTSGSGLNTGYYSAMRTITGGISLTF